jgi:hypothetical protein
MHDDIKFIVADEDPASDDIVSRGKYKSYEYRLV